MEQRDVEMLAEAIIRIEKHNFILGQALMAASGHECDSRPTCACCGVRCSPRVSHRLAPYAGVVCLTCSEQPAGRKLLDDARGYEGVWG